MGDSQWIKNLASAKYQNGVWLLRDREESLYHAKRELSDIIVTLMEDFEDASDQFNLYRDIPKEMKVVPLKSDENTVLYGFMVLVGPAQLKLEKRGTHIRQTLCLVSQYEKAADSVMEYAPHFDSFGGLLWKSGGNSIMTRQQLVRSALRGVCQLYFESDKDFSHEHPISRNRPQKSP